MNTTAAPPRVHWVVGTHWLVRGLSFPLMLLIIGWHLWPQPQPVLVWVLLGAQFLLYPHLLYWRARRAAQPKQAELQNLLLDSAVFGVWAAWLGFPLVITFILFICTAINNAILRGPVGIAWSLGLFAGTASLASALQGWYYQPEETLGLALFGFFGLSCYLLGIGVLAYRRNQILRQTREALRAHDRQLQALNHSLSERIEQIERLQDELREQAIRDPLTGLFNRRYLQSTLEREWARCQRDGQPLALLLLDIDHFKSINDRFGHGVGDQVLVQLGRLLSATTRREDLACRYGGEEFVLLLPGMGQDEAFERAQDWRMAFARLHLEANGHRVQLSLSIGLALAPQHARTPDELIHQADLALYTAKAQGRNRVELAQAMAPAAPDPA